MMRRRGFTLIELLVASAITAIMAASLGAVVSSALMVWGRLRRTDRLVIRPQVALERFSDDLRNSQRWSGIAFEGTADRVAAAAVVPDPEHPGAATVGRVSYWLEPDGRLCRAQQPYAGLEQQPVPACQAVATGVAGWTLDYFGRDPDHQRWSWLPRWSDPSARPVAVRATLTLRQPHPVRHWPSEWTDVVVLPTMPTR